MKTKITQSNGFTGNFRFLWLKYERLKRLKYSTQYNVPVITQLWDYDMTSFENEKLKKKKKILFTSWLLCSNVWSKTSSNFLLVFLKVTISDEVWSELQDLEELSRLNVKKKRKSFLRVKKTWSNKLWHGSTQAIMIKVETDADRETHLNMFSY